MTLNFEDLINEAIKLPMQALAVVCGDNPDTIKAIESSICHHGKR